MNEKATMNEHLIMIHETPPSFSVTFTDLKVKQMHGKNLRILGLLTDLQLKCNKMYKMLGDIQGTD